MSAYLKEQSPAVQVIGVQPDEVRKSGIRKWPEAYLPKIYDKARVDQLEYVSQSSAAEAMARRLAVEEGIFCGISAAGACEVALRLSEQRKCKRSFSLFVIVVIAIFQQGYFQLSLGAFLLSMRNGLVLDLA